MAFKLGSFPSARASAEELADFMEIECLKSSEFSFSITDAAQMMGIVDDESTAVDEEDENLEDLKLALSKIEDRFKWSNKLYPFVTDIMTLSRNEDCPAYASIVYQFLLLSTRESMSGTTRFVGSLDGTKLFEQLCKSVLQKLFGEHTNCFVFGTGSDEHESFIDKINRMLSSFKEKGYTSVEKSLNPFQKDGGIDLVAFIPFFDKRKGHFIVFAQCKTGTSWESCLSSLTPEILDDYVTPSLVTKPYPVFMVASDCGDPADWNTMARKVRGVFMDRCRIMGYLPDNLDKSFLDSLDQWNKGVLQRYE